MVSRVIRPSQTRPTSFRNYKFLFFFLSKRQHRLNHKWLPFWGTNCNGECIIWTNNYPWQIRINLGYIDIPHSMHTCGNLHSGLNKKCYFPTWQRKTAYSKNNARKIWELGWIVLLQSPYSLDLPSFSLAIQCFDGEHFL